MTRFDTFFIGGKWTAPATDAVLRVISPSSEEVVGEAPEGAAEDMARAVAEARRAFDDGPWPRMTPAERAAVLRKMASHIKAHANALAEALTDEVGTTLTLNVGNNHGAAMLLDDYADLAESLGMEETRQALLGPVTVRHEPVGVVAAIVPWNGP